MKMKRASIFAVVLLLASCTSFGNYFKTTPNFDQKSYESFTYLKADIMMFYDTFDTASTVEYEDFGARFNRIQEYEAGKVGNEEIVNQIKIIRGMFKRHYEENFTNHYSKTMIENKKEAIGIAFDVLIKTEYMKKR